MSSTLDASVISAAGRRVGRGCSGIPLRPSERMLLRRELLWKKMQEKYTQMEKSILSHKSIQINEIGDHDIQSLSTSCKEIVSQNTHIELPDESWENRHKYRKTMDSVQHWVNTSVHHPLSDSSDNISPTHSEQVETDLPASGRESPLCNSFPDINSRVQEYITSGKAVIKDVRNLDIMSGTSEKDQTLDELNLVKFMKQEKQPKKRKRLLRQENCSKNPDSESKTLITNKKHSRTIKDSNLTGCFISYNKSPVMSKKNAISGDKDNPLPEKLILKHCEKILMLRNGEDLHHSDKYTSVLRKETTLENHKSSTSIVKDIPVCKKETLMDIRTQSEQNLSSDTEKSDENCNMYPVSVMEKPVLGCKLQKTLEGCDTDTTVSTVLFCDKKALTSRREINMNENDMRKKSLQLNHIDTPTSQKRINAEKFNNSQTPRSGKILSSVSDARVAMIEEHVENCYTRPTIRMDDALTSRTEENLGDYSGSSILRKNKLLTIGKQVLLYMAEGTLKDLDHSSLSTEEQLSDEDEEKESLESIGVQVLGNGRKDQTSGTDVLTYEDVRVPVAREQHCEQSETSRKEILQTPEPVESCIQIKGQEILSSKCVDLPTSDEGSVVYSLEDASTIMFNPLLSCKYEHFLPEIRKKLENLQENYKEKDRGGRQVTHSEGRTGHIYVCSKRNSVFADQRNKINLDVSQHHPSYISETQGNSRDNKSYELTGDQQEEEEEESDTVNGNRLKDVEQYTSLQSEKEERANNSYDKISNSISQNMSITNKSNKESPKHSNKLLRFGTDKIKFNHCNSYDEDHGFEMNSKRETNPSLLSEYDENEAVMPDDDDDDIFCYRPPQHSSLHHERESNINKIFSLNTQNLSPRSTNYNNISGLRGKSEECKSVRTMVGDGSHRSVTETPHLSVELGHDRIGNTMTDDGKNPEQSYVLATKRKLTRSSNHPLGSECAEYEDDKADDGEITRKGFVLTKSKRKRETSDYLTGSSFSKTDSDNPTRVQSGATSNKICSEHDSYRQQFSEDVMDKVTSSDKFDDIRLKIEFKLESSGAEMQEGHLPTSKCLGNEKKRAVIAKECTITDCHVLCPKVWDGILQYLL
ncbi:uncharacterized protein LOC110834549 [Zootermopsis nevadensis]|uniref:uncharacterized protein LOC110834549 n=1 Tax=Zootermopsis nevadensis TaxID=136037 RepID=UPI000B8EA0D6|nr:uncharacterized protein LOC110834549 [Zootermopsis nevadensis]